MTTSDDYRAVSYWPNEDRRIIFTVRRTPETDAKTDDELVAEYGPKLEAVMDEHRPGPA